MRTLRLTEADYSRLKTRKTGPAPRRVDKTDYARVLARKIRDAGITEPVLEYAFDAQLDGGGRRWRIDLAWPHPTNLSVEVDGAVHRIKRQFKADLEKHQALFIMGWRQLRVSPAQVVSDEALDLVRRALA